MRHSSWFALALMLIFSGGTAPADTGGPMPKAQKASAPMLPGIDVSEYQSAIDWKRLKETNLAFVFIRATCGDKKDLRFDENWAGARGGSIFRGAYHYFYPGLFDPNDPEFQARLFLNTVGRLDDRDLPPVLDWEEADTPATTEENLARARAWLDQVERATGKTPIIYTNPGYWVYKLGNPKGFERYPLFIAHYLVKSPYVPSSWKRWTFWQTSGNALLPSAGIKKRVDTDLFSGTLEDLLALAAATPAEVEAMTPAALPPVAPPLPYGDQLGPRVVAPIELVPAPDLP